MFTKFSYLVGENYVGKIVVVFFVVPYKRQKKTLIEMSID